MASWLSSISSAVISASASALAGSSGIPGVQGYTLGDRVLSFEGKTLWSLYEGVKKDDSSNVSIFAFDLNTPSGHQNAGDRRSLLPLARNALRKLRTLRHPNVLKFLDGSESDSAVWIVTEPVHSLATTLDGQGLSDESKVFGLLHLATALSFLNKDGFSIHGNIRTDSIWITQGGEWKLGGMEICTRKDEDAGVIWTMAGMLRDARTYASPEVRKGGWTVLKEYEASALDSYQLHLLLHILFNGPLPPAFSSSSDAPPTLPQARGSIPAALFQAWRRLGNPNPRARLKTDSFLELGTGSESAGGGWWPSNRLVKLSAALEGFSLASESERLGLIRTLQTVSDGKRGGEALPEEFLRYKVLPSLVRTFEFGGGGPALLPLILALSESLPEKEYASSVLQPLVRMFATPDRAMRMALLEGLGKFADKLSNKDVVERIWPHLLTGFGDVVPVIREATVKSILLIAPKLNERILNNDLLRHLAKTQTDPEPGIRTNTCILLGRLSKHLQPSTNRKVLVPAFARALRDPFVHARIAGLMALMATADVYEKEDLAGKVIPAMSICLVDREKTVRDQGYKAIDMFVKKCEALTANMPETVIPVDNGQQAAALEAASQNQPGIATNAAGAAGALAGWAFASVTRKISSAELSAPIERRPSTPNSPLASPSINGAPRALHPDNPRAVTSASAPTTPSLALPGGFGGEEEEAEDWGGDLMDVNDDEGDWDGFESGQPPPPRVDPIAARLSSSKPKASPLRKPGGGALKLGAPARSSGLRVPMDMDAGDNWDIEEELFSDQPKVKPAPVGIGMKTKPRAAATPIARATTVARPTPTSAPTPTPTSTIAAPRPAATPAPAGANHARAPSVVVVPAPRPTPVAAAAPAAAVAPATPAPVTAPPPLPAPIVAATPRSVSVAAPSAPPAAAAEATPSVPASAPYEPAPLSARDSAPLPALTVSSTTSTTASSMPAPVSEVAIASTGTGTKEDKAAKMAAAREERRLRMFKAKEARR